MNGGGAAIGCLSAAIGLIGIGMLIAGPMAGTAYWGLKGLLFIAAAFILPLIASRFADPE